MSSQAPTATTRRDEIARLLRREIVCGALPPGTVIKDAQLAERLGTSITPVREALAQLAAEGLVDMPPNRAKRVATLSRQSAVELCEAMELLSVTLFTRGALRLTRSDLLLMRDALEAYRAAAVAKDVAVMFRTGRAFTDVAIRAGGNQEIRQMLRQILARFERLLTICYREGLLSYGLESNQAIFAALERGDPVEAARLYQEQLQAFQHAVERLPPHIWSA